MIRLAKERDIPDILKLLVQVNQVHADGRPDLFKGGKTKYDAEALKRKFKEPSERIWVFTDENERVLGYTFCVIEETPETDNTCFHRSLYIDDLCVEEQARHRHVGSALYENAKTEGRKLGCDRILLHVWECNPNAKMFYEKMGLLPMYYAMEQKL